MRAIIPYTAFLSVYVAAQSNIAFYDNLALCNDTFDSADAYGIFWFNPNVEQGYQATQPSNTSGCTDDSAWAITVTDAPATNNASATTQFALWYCPNNANYTDDFSLGYDVYAIEFGGADFIYNNTIYRGQSDNGSCLSALDQPCKDAIEQMSQKRALELVGDPTPQPNSNLTEESLPTVCDDIANSLKANWPKGCRYLFNNTPSAIVGAGLTQYAGAELYKVPAGFTGCYLNDTASNSTFWSAGTSIDPQSRDTYTGDVQVIAPLLTVFMPIANGDRITTIATAKSVLTCAHVNQFNEGAYVPPALPDPTPINYGSKKLSGGAIAGIVVAIVAMFIITDVIAFIWWKRRRAAKAKKMTGSGGVGPEGMTAEMRDVKAPMDAPPDGRINELSPDSILRPELPEQKSGPRVELAQDAQAEDMKKVNEGTPAELEAEHLARAGSMLQTPKAAYGR